MRGVAGAEAEIDSFLMSCRVIGRRAESAFLAWLLDTLAARGVRRLRATYAATAKNALVRDLWTAHGFSAAAPGAFTLSLDGDWRAAAGGADRDSYRDRRRGLGPL